MSDPGTVAVGGSGRRVPLRRAALLGGLGGLVVAALYRACIPLVGPRVACVVVPVIGYLAGAGADAGPGHRFARRAQRGSS